MPRDSARESLERRWARRLEPRPDLAGLVTGSQVMREPFHRWMAYKQAFAPALVRMFLKHERGAGGSRPTMPVLDPFSGAGTVTIECARWRAPAEGVEALPVLAFLARIRSTRTFPELPRLKFPDTDDWRSLADQLHHEVHRAALIFAHAWRHTSTGRLASNAGPLADVFRRQIAMMQRDLQQPLPRPVDVRIGDGRTLDQFGDACVSGMLTSPPYLSRHDYTRVTRPHEEVYSHWYPPEPLVDRRRRQVRAHPKAHRQAWSDVPHPAVQEATAELRNREEPKLAGVVRSYFEDLGRAIATWSRVLQPQAPLWIVIGGARLKDVYVPADLIVLELAVSRGFEIGEVWSVRRLTAESHPLGALADVAPRETILVLRRR